MTLNEFNKCVDEWADGLYRFVLKHLRDEDKARDIVQDTFEKVWNKTEEITFEKAGSYLFRTAYNTMVDRIRKDRWETNMEAVQNDPSTTTQYSDLKEILDEALKKLPEVQKTVILLRDYEGYTYEEIGTITGLKESQVKVYIYRGRKKMKEYIGNMEAVI